MSDSPQTKNSSVPRALKTAMHNARLAGPGTQQIAEDVAKSFGGKTTPLNYKGASSATRKYNDEGGNVKKLRDLARTTVIVSRANVDKAVNAIKNGKYKDFTVSRVKKQNFDTGYTGNIINLRHKKTGQETEIQVNTPKMIYAKEKFKDAWRMLGAKTFKKIHKETGLNAGWGHALYEDERTRKKGRPGTNEDSRKMRAKALSSAYYKNFQS